MSQPTTNSFGRRLADWKPRRWALLVLLCVVLFARGKLMQADAFQLIESPSEDSAYVLGVYRSATLGDGSRNRTATPSAIRSPAYPLLVAGVTRLATGNQDRVLYGDEYIVGYLHVLLSAITAWAIWRLGLAWQLPAWAALLAVAFATFSPLLIRETTHVGPALLAACLTALALLALSRAAHAKTWTSCGMAGGCVALCLLIKAALGAWLLAVLVAAPLVVEESWRLRLRIVLALFSGAALVLAPWVGRNWYQSYRPIFTTARTGYTLLVVNNPYYYQWLRSSNQVEVSPMAEFESGWRRDVRLELQRINGTPRSGNSLQAEAQINSLAYRTAWRNICQEPGMFAYGCCLRAVRPFTDPSFSDNAPGEAEGNDGRRFAVLLFNALLIIAALISPVFLGRKLWRSPWIWALLLVLSLALVHVLVGSDVTMRAALVPVAALGAATTVAMLAAPRPIATPGETKS